MKVNGTGLFAKRLLYVDWLEERSLSANPTVVTPSDEFLAPAIRADGINVDAASVILRGEEDSRTTPRPQGEVLAEPAGGQARKYSRVYDRYLCRCGARSLSMTGSGIRSYATPLEKSQTLPFRDVGDSVALPLLLVAAPKEQDREIWH